MHGQLQHPAARLAGRPPRSSVVPLEPVKNKVFKPRDKTPARGACREGQPRHVKELAATCHVSRQGPVSDKLPGATRQRPRQGACRGRLPLYTRAPAHPPTCRPGTFPGTRGKRLCGQQCAVASDADKIAIMASGGVPDGPFLHCLGDADRHLMPLSPAVRVRYDNTVVGGGANRSAFSIFALLYVVTCR